MESRPATMTKASRAGVTLPEEIVVWEILARLPPKALLRCRAVCHSWRHATSTRSFLQAHHGHQPCLPIISGSEYGNARYKNILSFHHRAAGTRFQPLVRLEHSFYPEASCDGLLVLSDNGITDTGFSVCNPATRQHAPLRQISGFTLLGMYVHGSTGEYRLLLQQQTIANQVDCYVFVLGSDQSPRYIGGLGVAATEYLHTPALVHQSLHWLPIHYYWIDPLQYQAGSKEVIVFDTTSESFRWMNTPVVPNKSYIFEMDGTLGIYSYNDTTQTVDIWILRNYESGIWGYSCVELPAAEIRWRFKWLNANLCVNVVSVDGDVLLLVTQGGWMFYVNIDGKLVDHFHRDGQHVTACKLRLKQTLVPHAFFEALEGYVVNATPFV